MAEALSEEFSRRLRALRKAREDTSGHDVAECLVALASYMEANELTREEEAELHLPGMQILQG